MLQSIDNINLCVWHCSATKADQDIGFAEINQWHEAPCDIKDKNGKIISVRYQGKNYGSRLLLPKHTINGVPILNLHGRGWWSGDAEMGCGYHVIIRRDGSLELGRPFNIVGSHAYGHNINSIALVWIGGIGKDGKPEDNRTPEQKKCMLRLKWVFDIFFKKLDHVGHRDLSTDIDGDGIIEPWEWLKACPCFTVKEFFGIENNI